MLNTRIITAAVVVTIVGYFTYFRNYDEVAKLFWDENYHIAAAQKYLDGTFFLEPHPPLGKLLIAAGEALLRPNAAPNKFSDTDYIKTEDLPENFSFKGFRFFPTLFAWLTAPLLFLCFVAITGSAAASLLLSSFYLFDNALIVHMRGAMLDSFLIFFIVAGLLAYLKVRCAHGSRRSDIWGGVLLGSSIAGATAVKSSGLILILLPIFLSLEVRPLKRLIALGSSALLSFALIYIAVWQIHFSLGRSINTSLPKKGIFLDDPGLRELVQSGAHSSIINLPKMWLYSQRFFTHYTKGVPKLNLCKQKENGSPSFIWPLGARAINYRWEKVPNQEDTVRYFYLQSNPVVWLAALAGVLIASAAVLSKFFFDLKHKLSDQAALLAFLSLYFAYMFTMTRITRVMYLYHYFIPLIFSFLIFALILKDLAAIGPIVVTEKHKRGFLISMTALIIISYMIYSPLTYSQPISNQRLQKLAWMSIWDLTPAGGERTNLYAKPLPEAAQPKLSDFAKLKLSSFTPILGSQQWGMPQRGKTVTEKPLQVGGKLYEDGFGLHARTHLGYRLERKVSRFTGIFALPDYLKTQGGSVTLTVRGDGELLFKTDKVTTETGPVPLDIPLAGVHLFEIEIGDGGDNIDHDHALILEPALHL